MDIQTYHLNKPITFNTYLVNTILLVICIGLIGCGSGGDSSTQADADLLYTGITTQAEIDAANADQLAGEALEGSSTGSSLGMLEAAQVDETDSQSNLRIVNLPLNLKSVVSNSDSTILQMIINGVWVHHSGTLTDSCGLGGYVDYDKSYENTSGEFQATYWFYDFCDKGSFINGVVSSSGFVNPADPDELYTATQRFRKLTDGSATLSGRISVNAAGSPIVIVFNALIRDETTGKVYKISNYTLEIVEYSDPDPASSYITVDVSGRFYNPDYGYIELSTVSLLVIGALDEHPRSGAIVIEGKDNKAIKLTANDNTSCKIEADLDGDGDFDDYLADPVNWDDL